VEKRFSFSTHQAVVFLFLVVLFFHVVGEVGYETQYILWSYAVKQTCVDGEICIMVPTEHPFQFDPLHSWTVMCPLAELPMVRPGCEIVWWNEPGTIRKPRPLHAFIPRVDYPVHVPLNTTYNCFGGVIARQLRMLPSTIELDSVVEWFAAIDQATKRLPLCLRWYTHDEYLNTRVHWTPQQFEIYRKNWKEDPTEEIEDGENDHLSHTKEEVNIGSVTKFPRLITAAAPRTIYIMGRRVHSILQHCKATFASKRARIAFTSGYTLEELGQRVEYMESTCPSDVSIMYADVDYKKFDGTQQVHCFMAINRVIQQLCLGNPVHAARFKRYYQRLAGQWTIKHFDHRDKGGFAVRGDASRASGDCDTTAGNTILNWCVLQWVAKLVRDQVGETWWTACMTGDDSLLLFDARYAHVWEAAFTRVRELGLDYAMNVTPNRACVTYNSKIIVTLEHTITKEQALVAVHPWIRSLTKTPVELAKVERDDLPRQIVLAIQKCVALQSTMAWSPEIARFYGRVEARLRQYAFRLPEVCKYTGWATRLGYVAGTYVYTHETLVELGHRYDMCGSQLQWWLKQFDVLDLRVQFINHSGTDEMLAGEFDIMDEASVRADQYNIRVQGEVVETLSPRHFVVSPVKLVNENVKDDGNRAWLNKFGWVGPICSGKQPSL